MILFPHKKQSKKTYLRNYLSTYNKIINNIDFEYLEKIKKLIQEVIKNKKKIFTAGNGGSASVANHLMCDYLKSIKLNTKKKLIPRVYSLCNSVELITAISNDENFDEIFNTQLESFGEKDDLVIMFSCSGSSGNIIKLIKSAKKIKCKTILFSGFGKKNKNVNFNLNLQCKNFGLCEDVFSSLMHSIMQTIIFENSNLKKLKI